MTHANPLNLYLGENTDYKGRTLEEILAWTDNDLEITHDYIQVLFPTTVPSEAVRRSPFLQEQTVADINSDPEVLKYVQSGLRKSFSRMLSFYGLDMATKSSRVIIHTSGKPHVNWSAPGNHNERRISRIISCLNLFDLGNVADELSAYLKKTFPTHPSGRFWGYDP